MTFGYMEISMYIVFYAQLPFIIFGCYIHSLGTQKLNLLRILNFDNLRNLLPQFQTHDFFCFFKNFHLGIRSEHNNRTQFKLEPPDIFQSQSEGYQSGTGSFCGSGSSGMFTPDLSPSNETIPVNLIPSDIFPNLAKPSQTNHFEPNPNQNGVGPISFRVTSSTIPQIPSTLPKLEAKPIDPNQPNQNSYPEMPKRKSKKGPAPKLFGNEKCKICESRATGFHYNVLSCEACKVSNPCFGLGSVGSNFYPLIVLQTWISRTVIWTDGL